MEYASARDFDERSSTGGSTSGCGAKGDAFSHFEEEDNFKGIWRRAFHTLKIKDKEKDKNLKKNLIKKRDSKSNMNQEKTTHSSKEMDDVDPVYSLLKSAAGKGPKSGSCSCLNSDFSVADSAYAESSNTSSPTSEANKSISSLDGSDPGNAYDSTSIHTGTAKINWTKRKAMMNAFRLKSVSFEENSSTLYSSNQSSAEDSDAKPLTTFDLDTIQVTTSDSSVSPLSNRNKRRGQWRMKSFSLDMPDEPSSYGDSNEFVADEKSKKSTHSENIESATSYNCKNNLKYLQHHPQKMLQRIQTQQLVVNPAQYKLSDYEEQQSSYQERNYDYYGGQSMHCKAQEKHLSGNLYVVITDYRAKNRTELDLWVGDKISVLDSKDPDWWKGKCFGRVGYFPAIHAQRIRPGDQVYCVVRPVELCDKSGCVVRLFRRQIVVTTGNTDNNTTIICTKDGRELFCPLDYLEKLCD